MSQGTAEKGENETAAESSLLSSSTALSHFQCKLLFCLRIHSNNMHSIHNCLGVFIVRSCLMAELAWNSDQPFKKKKTYRQQPSLPPVICPPKKIINHADCFQRCTSRSCWATVHSYNGDGKVTLRPILVFMTFISYDLISITHLESPWVGQPYKFFLINKSV